MAEEDAEAEGGGQLPMPHSNCSRARRLLPALRGGGRVPTPADWLLVKLVIVL